MSARTEDKVTGSGRRTSSKDQSAPTAWQVMREGRQDDVHPFWVHSLATAGFTLFAATLTSLTYDKMPWWGWLIMAACALFAGLVFGFAAGHGTGAGESIAQGSATFGLGLAAAIVGISWYAAEHDLAHHPFSGSALVVYAMIAGGGLVAGSIYRWLWTLAIETRDSRFPRQQREKATRSKNVWIAGFSACGLGDVFVEPHENAEGNKVPVDDTGARVRLFVRLDPTRPEINKRTVENKAEQLIRTVNQLLKDGGEQSLGRGDYRIEDTDERDVIGITVFRADPLAGDIETVIPSTPHEFRVDDPKAPHHAGMKDNGDRLLVPFDPSKPHKFVIGGSGSGKSNWLRNLAYAAARREFVVPTFAALEKYSQFLDPFRRSQASVFLMTGGGDTPTEKAWSKAMCTLVAAYLLYRHRTDGANAHYYKGTNFRDGGWIGSPEHPTLWCFLDEWDALVKFRVRTPVGEVEPRITLPTGERVTAWDMIESMSKLTRSVGVELVLASQRGDSGSYGGKPVKNVIVNTKQRFVHAIDSTYDIEAFGVSATHMKQLSSMEHCMLFNLDAKPGRPMPFSKGSFVTDDDIELISELAYQAGTIGGFSDHELDAMGEWWVFGEVPDDNPAARALAEMRKSKKKQGGGEGESAGSGQSSELSLADQAKIKLAEKLRAEGREPLFSVPGESPSKPTETAASSSEPEWAQEIAEQLKDVTPADFGAPEFLEPEQAPLPSTPIELLAHIVDAWEPIADEKPSMGAQEMVHEFHLHYLDQQGRQREAAKKLGAILQGQSKDDRHLPDEQRIQVSPRKTRAFNAYFFEDVKAEWDRLRAAFDESGED